MKAREYQENANNADNAKRNRQHSEALEALALARLLYNHVAQARGFDPAQPPRPRDHHAYPQPVEMSESF